MVDFCIARTLEASCQKRNFKFPRDLRLHTRSTEVLDSISKKVAYFKNTSRALAPSPGPTMPRCSRMSTIRAARV